MIFEWDLDVRAGDGATLDEPQRRRTHRTNAKDFDGNITAPAALPLPETNEEPAP